MYKAHVPDPVSEIVTIAAARGITMTTCQPMHVDGFWWIDAQGRHSGICLDWKPGRGFGVYGRDAGFLGPPAHIVEDPSIALDHAVSEGRRAA